MVFKQFIGKTLLHVSSGKRYVLTKATAPYLEVRLPKKNVYGTYDYYLFECGNCDPITEGVLTFEDARLNEQFKQIYAQHSRSEYGKTEDFMYWLNKD